MKKLTLITLITLGLCLMGQMSWAARAYVIDSFKITLRTGPSNENKVISMPSSGDAVEVLETQDTWTHVRLLDRGQGTVEGWVLSRYLIDRLPWEMQAKSLKAENTQLKEKMAHLEGDQVEAARREKELTAELVKKSDALKKLQNKHESLKQGAGEYLQLKEQHETTRAKLASIQNTAQTLTAENERLRSSRRNTWFATGAAILLIGLFIGLTLGKREKKRKSLYY